MAVPQFTQLPLTAQEEWRPVVGWEGRYEVSNLGRVRSIVGATGRRRGVVLRWNISRTRYPSVAMWSTGKRRRLLVHRAVAAAFLGPCPPGRQVHHKDHDRGNPVLTNLEYVTPSENTRHAYAVGAIPRYRNLPRGSEHWAAKLTEADVRAIRASTASPYALADRYGISYTCVWSIRRRKTWKHVRD